MRGTRSISFFFALALLPALTGRCFAGTVFDFQYLFPAPDTSGFFETVSASGTLTTGDFDPDLGGYLVQGITGTRTVTLYDGDSPTSFDSQITGLVAPGTFFNSNVLYYPGPAPYLDFSGLSFTVDDALHSNDGAGDVLVYFDPFQNQYSESFSGVWYGTFTASPEVPEPSTGLLVIGALLAAAGSVRVRRPNA